MADELWSKFRIAATPPRLEANRGPCSFSACRTRASSPFYIAVGFIHGTKPAAPASSRRRKSRSCSLRHGRLVLKPCHRGEGQGIALLHADGDTLRINGVAASPHELASIVAKVEHAFVSEFVVQHEYARALFPETSNTVRVLTLWDDERGEPFIAAAAHRIGTRRSFPVDNFHQGGGGLCANIDLETGRLSDSRRFFAMIGAK